MIDPSLRAERVVEEAKDPETAVILVDCVIGYGSHEIRQRICLMPSVKRKIWQPKKDVICQ